MYQASLGIIASIMQPPAKLISNFLAQTDMQCKGSATGGELIIKLAAKKVGV